MVQSQGIDVYLAPFDNIGKRYQEHVAPLNSPVFSGGSNDVWIEAVNGERFVIVMDLSSDFDSKGSTSLRLCRSVDGNETVRFSEYSQLKSSVTDGADLAGHHLWETEATQVDGLWAKCSFAFAQLEMDEEMDMDQSQIGRSIATRGNITVSIERGHQQPRSKGYTALPWTGRRAPDTEISSKAVVKDNHVSHAIRHVALEEADQPTDCSDTTWNALSGQWGKTMNFTIRYRSRDILQRLKIIPRDEVHIDLTVSPPPSPRVKRENGDGLIEHEGKEDERDNKGIKQDALSKNAGRTQRPADLPTGAHGDAREPGQQRDRKRKAMQDELVEVELEHRGVMLEQRKLRLTKALAETE